ncbi:hypothetical protein [Inquilinus limosus]|uniref:Uncharacterized protein n=1 Tax=Inquilinus limosus TaxID=171674 RepID=A0A211ZGR7_9PROT|nr:hypothetical protein [Inquilinus limosus]OWJ64472.1 hypothetical protein BWR60_24620 [Inquilinus limosus]
MGRSLARASLLALLALTAAAPAFLLHPAAALADDDDDDDDGGWRHHHRHRHWRDGPPPYYYYRPHRDRVIVYDDEPDYVVRRPRPVYVEPPPGITINIPLRFD